MNIHGAEVRDDTTFMLSCCLRSMLQEMSSMRENFLRLHAHKSWVLSTSAKAIAFLIIVGIVTYLVTWTKFMFQRCKISGQKSPPIVPYSIPYFGYALNFALDPSACVRETSRLVGQHSAYGVKVLGDTLYFLSGPEHIAKLSKYKTSITDPGIQTFCLTRVFGMAQKSVEMYTKDDSGIELKNYPSSSVSSSNRIDLHTHANFLKLLNNSGLNELTKRWMKSFLSRLKKLSITSEWHEQADIMDFWMPILTASLNEAMTGSVLERINPNFSDDFVEFLPYVHGLMKRLPRWCIPRAFVLRESLQRDVKEWHAQARVLLRSSDNSQLSGSDPWFGLAAMRERQEILGAVDNWDHDAIASSDFALLWGANINVHPSAIWTIIEVFNDRALLQRVRSELHSISTNADDGMEYIDQIMTLPLLQSIYAEVLRLRVKVQSVFRGKSEDITINEWKFPKGNLVLVPTEPAHMDSNSWNTKDGKYPLSQFWSDRFLIYPDDPDSGPRLPKTTGLRKNKEHLTRGCSVAPSTPKFSTAGLADMWIPYGIGERTCPGRFFARREILAFCATIVQEFDIALPRSNVHIPSNSVFYGLGVQRPLHKLPFKIRKRRATTETL